MGRTVQSSNASISSIDQKSLKYVSLSHTFARYSMPCILVFITSIIISSYNDVHYAYTNQIVMANIVVFAVRPVLSILDKPRPSRYLLQLMWVWFI